MSDLSDYLKDLSPKKRALFERMLKERKNEKPKAAIQTIPPRQSDAASPLSFAQQQLWLLYQLEHGRTAYNLPEAMRLTGTLHIDVLVRTLNEVVRRHEILRTVFPMIDDQAVQIVQPPSALEVPVVDLCAVPREEQEAIIHRRTREEAHYPFDLARGPMVRFSIARLGPTEHVLFITMHHIVADGWSVAVLVREITLLYTAFLQGQPSPLPELPIQYADFATWERQWLQGNLAQDQLAYWKEALADAPPCIRFPMVGNRPASQTFKGATYPLRLSKALSAALSTLSRREGVTLFMTMFAAFHVLLSRYTGQQNICVGTPISGRRWAETQDLIGFFLNTLVLRTDSADKPSFRTLLTRAKTMIQKAFANADIPFELVVRTINPKRSRSHTPLFQVLFVFETISSKPLELPGLAMNRLWVANETASFDLMLDLLWDEQQVGGGIQYNTDLFSPAMIGSMADSFVTLLEEIVANPDVCVATVPLLQEAERRHRAVDWASAGSSPSPVPEPQTVTYPTVAREHPAFFVGQRQITHGQVMTYAKQLAARLLQHGVGPDARVGIVLPPSAELALALLATLSIGATPVLLNPQQSDAELGEMSSSMSLAVLLTDTARLAALSATVTPRLAVELFQEPPADSPVSNLSLPGHWTGVLPLKADDRVLVLTSCAPAIASRLMVATLLAGGSLVFPETSAAQVSGQMETLIHDLQVTTLVTHTGQLAQLIGSAFPALRSIVTVGEVYLSATSHAWIGEREHYHLLADGELALAYANDAAAMDRWPAILAPSAKPHACVVLDDAFEPVPVGVPGELYLYEPLMALSPADRNASRSPAVHEWSPQMPLYPTGVLAWYDVDGTLRFASSRDNWVSLGGYTVNLLDITHVLVQHNQVQEAFVTLMDSGDDQPKLLACIVPRHQTQVAMSELRALVKQQLPEYMLPAAWLFVEQLPQTASGAVDRQALITLAQSTTLGSAEISGQIQAPGHVGDEDEKLARRAKLSTDRQALLEKRLRLARKNL